MRRRILLLPLLLMILLTAPAFAQESEPQPNNRAANALLFGTLDAPLPPDTTPPQDWQVGSQKTFHVLNVSTGQMGDYPASVFLLTENIVFWIEEPRPAEPSLPLIEQLQRFDTELLPLLRETFGEENRPGIDNDPRFHVLFSSRIGNNYNGYFSASDKDDRRVNPFSNQMDLLILNTLLLRYQPSDVIDTLSHEFQHMVHHHWDPNEDNFIDEGLSGLAEYLVLGTIRPMTIKDYLNDTGRSLIHWPASGSSTAYYGSSFLFSVYLYDRFGADFIRALVQSPGNGMTGLEQALRATAQTESAEQVFSEWAAALLGELRQRPDPDLGYSSYRFPQQGIYRDLSPLTCGTTEETHEISSFGLRFFTISCSGKLHITGEAAAPVTTLAIPGGESAWRGGDTNNARALLRREFDLRELTSPILFSFETNYDLETNYDYFYLLIRDEEGKTVPIRLSNAADTNPTGQNLGCGVTGNAGGIHQESVDLSPWAGQKIEILLLCITDSATLGEGILLNHFELFSNGLRRAVDTGWVSEGFNQIPAEVPLRYGLIFRDGNEPAQFFEFSGGCPMEAVCQSGDCAFAVTLLNTDIRTRSRYTLSVTK